MLVGVVATVVVAAITATVESVELVAPPHDARPATRRAARSLFMPLVYTTMVVSRIPDPDTCSFEHRQDAGVEGFRRKIRF